MKRRISQRIGLLSAVLSLPAAAAFVWMALPILYAKIPQYKEFVTGHTIWTAYYKSGDMNLAYLLIGSVLCFYVLFLLLFSILSKKISWLSKEIDVKQTYHPGWKKRWIKIQESCFFFLFMLFSSASLLKAVDFMIPGNILMAGKSLYILEILCAAASLVFFYYYERQQNERKMNRLLAVSQLLLPLCFLGISQYEYLRNGSVITQYDSVKVKIFFGILTIVLLGYNCYCIFVRDRKKEERIIYLTSFLSLAVFASYELPKGVMSGTPIEMFHYGEISVPFHQMISFGKIPYLNMMPLHGICDYFQSGICYLLFDGSYASFEAAIVIGCVITAVLTAVIIYYFVDQKFIGLLCILLFSLFGDPYYYIRWAFSLPFLLILFSEKVRTDFFKLLWNWTFLSILSIAWNPPIGGALALAVLPMILYEGIYEKGWKFLLDFKESRSRRRILSWYLPLMILGICFIPMFFAILQYIAENSKAILETTGDILKQELTSIYEWYAMFGFLFPLLAACYFLVGKKGEEKKLAAYALLFLILFNGIIVKYTFVRTQFGERAVNVTCLCNLFVLLAVLIPYLKKYRSVSIAVTAFFLLALLTGFKGADLLRMPQKMFLQDEIPADTVYAPVEETGIKGLGDIYLAQDQKTEIQNLYELTQELKEYQFLDMSNQHTHYNILNKEALLPFSSTYNINNKVMQTESIEILEKRKPEVVLVWPGWEHDSGPLSIRNYYLYRYLAEHYVPCKYKNIIFMTNQPKIQEQYEPAYEELGQIMHMEELKKLPLMWGNEYLEEQETEDVPISYHLIDTNAEKKEERHYRLTADENYFFYAFEEKTEGSQISFLRICIEDPESAERDLSFHGVVYFMNEKEGLEESHRFQFDGGKGEFLIPLSSSPYWFYSDNIASIMVDFIGGDLPDRELKIHLEFETLKR